MGSRLKEPDLSGTSLSGVPVLALGPESRCLHVHLYWQALCVTPPGWETPTINPSLETTEAEVTGQQSGVTSGSTAVVRLATQQEQCAGLGHGGTALNPAAEAHTTHFDRREAHVSLQDT